jgi:hypothetical protein
MRLVVGAALDAAAEQRLVAVVQNALGHPFRIELCYEQGDVAAGAGGKFDDCVCRVAP